jgi:hypothetical protein
VTGLSTGLKKKLTMNECKVETNGTVTIVNNKFEVMLNPSSYSHKYSICYSQKKTFGQLGNDSKFSSVSPENISFSMVIDGTGVVNLPIAGVGSPDVKTQIEQLNTIVYKYDGEDHEPNQIRLLWGSLKFFGRLESMSVEYTLFKPSGEPLRAKVNLSFTGFLSKEEAALKANKSSPDLSHIVEVKAGDTLPLLCYRVYKDSSYYTEVAKINKLIDFRHLTPGSILHFPPLR